MTSTLVSIGDQPEPRRVFGRPPTFMNPLLPQHAWLAGSVLIVQRKQERSQCDLATAARIALRSPPTLGLGWSFLVLYAFQEPRGRPTRLVVDGPDWSLLSGAQLRLLAQAIGSRGDKASARLVWRLSNLAAREEIRSRPVDWSFRSDPKGTRRSTED